MCDKFRHKIRRDSVFGIAQGNEDMTAFPCADLSVGLCLAAELPICQHKEYELGAPYRFPLFSGINATVL